MRVIAAALILCSIAPSFAEESISKLLKSQGYSCVIKATYLIGDDGNLAESEYTVGRRFTIDRGTGRTIGAIKNYNTTVYGNFQPTVVDRGNHEQYFKALTMYGSHNPSIAVLVVQEFAKSELKPFMFTHSGSVQTGVCENI